MDDITAIIIRFVVSIALIIIGLFVMCKSQNFASLSLVGLVMFTIGCLLALSLILSMVF